MNLNTGAAVAAALTLLGACTDRPAKDPAAHNVEYGARLVAVSPAEVEFGRIGAVAVDSQGTMYVVDAPSTLVLLDSAARFVRTLGKMGEGPGEFMGISGVQVLPGDTLFVFDAPLSRVTSYAPRQERPAHVQTLEQGEMEFARQVRRYPDGALVGYYAAALTPDGSFPERTREFLRGASQDGRPNGTRVNLPGTDVLSLARGPGTHFAMPQFARRTMVQLGPEYIYTLYSDSARVQVFDPRGAPVSTFRPDVPAAQHPIARATYDSMGIDLEPSMRSAMRPRLEARWRTWPLYDGLLADDRGNLWIKPTNPGGPNHWFRVDADGTRTGSVVLPPGASPRLFAGDRVYCVVRDELDVETLAVYALAPARTSALASNEP